MALDIYCGPLTRYYANNWENEGESLAKEMGVPYTIITPDGEVDQSSMHPNSAPALIELINAWRTRLYDGLKDNFNDQFDWIEDYEGKYITERLFPTCVEALSVRVDYYEKNQTPPKSMNEVWYPTSQSAKHIKPKGFFKKLFGKKEEEKSTDADKSRYPNLGLDFWLPADFNFTFESVTPLLHKRTFGSSYQLLRELEELALGIWNATPVDIEKWAELEPEEDELDDLAKLGLNMQYDVTKYAVANRMPMILDW